MKSALGAHCRAQTQEIEKIQTLAKAPCLHLLMHQPRSREYPQTTLSLAVAGSRRVLVSGILFIHCAQS